MVEIHGTAFAITSLNCGESFDRDEMEKPITNGEKDPRCNTPSGILNPAPISFGQATPEDKMASTLK